MISLIVQWLYNDRFEFEARCVLLPFDKTFRKSNMFLILLFRDQTFFSTNRETKKNAILEKKIEKMKQSQNQFSELFNSESAILRVGSKEPSECLNLSKPTQPQFLSS